MNFVDMTLALCRRAKLNNGDDAGVPSRSCQKNLTGEWPQFSVAHNEPQSCAGYLVWSTQDRVH